MHSILQSHDMLHQKVHLPPTTRRSLGTCNEHLQELAAGNTSNAESFISRLDHGDGLVTALFTDTVMTQQLNHSLNTIQQASEQTSTMIAELKKVVENMKNGEGPAGMLLTDTTFRNSLHNSILNVEEGTAKFSENMEALKSNFLFRRYFRRLEKKKAEHHE